MIACNVVAVGAARAATATIPIVFVTGGDPVKSGLVASLNRPEANLTGVTFFGTQLTAKQLELLRDLVSKAAVFAVLGDVNYPTFEAELPAVERLSVEPCASIMVARYWHREHRTLARLARHGHVAAHHPRKLASDGEP